MTAYVAAALFWLLHPAIALRGRLGPSVGRWSRRIAWRPSEALSPEQLSGCLLGANLALLLRDDFNQLGSALPPSRIRQILRAHWSIATAPDWRRAIDAGLQALGRPDPAGVLAWNIQQLACLVRLGFTLGYTSRADAEQLLARLRVAARARYGSWMHFSLAALAGAAAGGAGGRFERAEWARFGRTHAVLLHPQRSPIRHALHWHGASADPSPGPVRPGQPAPAGGPVR